MEFEDIYSTESVEKNDNKYERNHNEESIYETERVLDRRNSTNFDLNKFNFNFSATDKKLCFIGNDSDFIPTEIIYEFGLKTLILDISFNCISDLRDLQQFPYLEELICDNNLITEKTDFPKLENLKILSCNKNQIEDIHVFIDKVKVQFPNLVYLSLLGNLACPNQLIDSSKDEFDYSRYRKYVLYRLRNLKFLDCYEVTKEEKEIILKDSLFYDVIKANDNMSKNKSLIDDDKDVSNLYTPLPNKSDKEENKPQGSFGYCRYTYYGKQSEGNRFIKNDDL